MSWELFEEAGKTRLRLTHTALDTFPQTPAYAKKNFIQGWTAILGTSLKNFIES